METKTLSFRLPLGWTSLLDNAVLKYGFTSRGELLALSLTDTAYNGKLKLRGTISPPTVVLACRLPLNIHQTITSRAIKDKVTISEWCALAIARWWQELQKEDARQFQKGISYSFFKADYAKILRNKVAVYNKNMGING